MDILILTTCLSSGGAERIAADLSNGLSDEHEVSLCIFNRQLGVDYPYTGELFDLQVDVSGPVRKLFSLQQKLPRLQQIKRDQQIDVTISLLNGPNLANLMTPAGDRQVVTIVNCISRTFGGLAGVPRRFLMRMSYNRADHIVALSEGVKNDAVKQKLVRSDLVSTIYNPADVQSIQKQSRKPLSDRYRQIFEHPVLINVGRLTRQKGQTHLLHIFDRIKERRPDVKLLILGTGDKKQDLLRQSRALGFQTYSPDDKLAPDRDVYFMGFQSNPFQFVRAADCFVFPSLWEGLGSVLIESLACGTPVIASDCRYGPREVLSPDTPFDHSTHEPEQAKFGFLMPDFHTNHPGLSDESLHKMWSDCVESLLNDESLRDEYSERGKERAQRFNTDRIVSEWNELIYALG